MPKVGETVGVPVVAVGAGLGPREGFDVTGAADGVRDGE